jgi:lysosomal acid lipase/cholesteryl ester hydrolase
MLVKGPMIGAWSTVVLLMSATGSLSRGHAQETEKTSIIGGLFGFISNDGGDLKKSTHRTKTADGWKISINRYLKKGKASPRPKAAVILCHGFNINNKFWDIDNRSSLARYLAANGYDVWAPSLRGSGSSSKPLASKLRGLLKFDVQGAVETLQTSPEDVIRSGWTIDDHIHQDVPAIVDFVREESGFDRVYWIGHSMGGIVMFGYLETEEPEKIAGFIPIGAMMVMPDPLTPHLEEIATQKLLLTASLVINTTVASQLSNYTLGTIASPVEKLLLERKNMHGDVVFRFFNSCIDDTSAGVVAQFSDSIGAGSIFSIDKEYNYTDNLPRVTTPILLMAGGADGFVTEGMMRKTHAAVSSPDKEVIIFSKANGHSMDYGHCDLILGKNSTKDVYPAVLDWLDKRVGHQ